MGYLDENNLYIVEEGDDVAPLHPLLNTITASVGAALNDGVRIRAISALSERDELEEDYPPSKTEPLFIYNRVDQQLESNYGHGWFSGLEYDTGWQEVTVSSGWTAGHNPPPAFRRLGNTVWGRGHCNVVGSFPTSYQEVFVIPAEFRPSSVVRIEGMSNGGLPHGWDIGQSGSARVMKNAATPGSPTWVALDNLRWLAD